MLEDILYYGAISLVAMIAGNNTGTATNLIWKFIWVIVSIAALTLFLVGIFQFVIADGVLFWSLFWIMVSYIIGYIIGWITIHLPKQ